MNANQILAQSANLMNTLLASQPQAAADNAPSFSSFMPEPARRQAADTPRSADRDSAPDPAAPDSDSAARERDPDPVVAAADGQVTAGQVAAEPTPGTAADVDETAAVTAEEQAALAAAAALPAVETPAPAAVPVTGAAAPLAGTGTAADPLGGKDSPLRRSGGSTSVLASLQARAERADTDLNADFDSVLSTLKQTAGTTTGATTIGTTIGTTPAVPGAAALLGNLTAGAVDKALAQATVAAEGVVTDAGSKKLTALTGIVTSLGNLQARYAADGRAAAVQTTVPVPVGQPQWPAAIAEKVMWMSAQGLSSAEIHLDPAELGPLQVRVTVNQDQASVAFTSQHAAVREALDQGAFRLREMFNSEGMNLVNVDVSDQSLAGQFGQGQGEQGSRTANGAAGAEAAEEEVTTTAIRHQGLVSYYV